MGRGTLSQLARRVAPASWVTLAAFITVSLWPSHGYSQAPPPSGPPDALEAFRKIWSDAENWSPGTGYVYRYRRTLYPTMTLDEIEARAAEIVDLPDHPDHRRLRTQRRRLETGADTTEFQVWWEGPEAFRFNRTFAEGSETSNATAPALPWLDSVFSTDVAWTLTGDPNGADGPAPAGQLTIVQPGESPPEGRADPRAAANDAAGALGLLLAGGIVRPFTSFVVPTGAMWSGPRLIGVAEPSSRVVTNASGMIPSRRFTFSSVEGGDPQTPIRNRWRTDRIEIAPSGPGVDDGWVVQFSDHRLDPTLGAWVSGRVDKVSARGQLLERFEFIDARPINAGEFAAVSAMPTPDGTDAVRGGYTYRSVFDFRPGVERITMYTDGGEHASPMPPSLRRGGRVPSSLPWIGWTAAGLLIASLIAIRVYRARS